MKIITSKKILFISLVLALSAFDLTILKKVKKTHKNRETPRGLHLRNHYGADKLDSPYGPKDDQVSSYVERNSDNFFPFRNLDKREQLENANDYPARGSYPGLNPSPLKAGRYSNIAPSADHEINPEITGPKLEVTGDYQYPVNAKVPTFYGMSNENKHVLAYDKFTGDIFDDTVHVRQPKMGYENRVINVNREFHNHYDLRTGNRITVFPKVQYHGINTAPEWKGRPKEENECSSDDSNTARAK